MRRGVRPLRSSIKAFGEEFALMDEDGTHGDFSVDSRLPGAFERPSHPESVSRFG
jgi:hypothetical protein